jgi:hypothetical protein
MRSEILLPNCHYKRLENGIHVFVFRSNTRFAVDDYLTILETSPLTRGEVVLEKASVLIQLASSGMPPVAYMMLRSRDFLKSHKDRIPAIRIVYLYSPGFVLPLVHAFIDLFSERKRATRRFFPIAEREQAEAWLLEECSAQKHSLEYPE